MRTRNSALPDTESVERCGRDKRSVHRSGRPGRQMGGEDRCVRYNGSTEKWGEKRAHQRSRSCAPGRRSGQRKRPGPPERTVAHQPHRGARATILGVPGRRLTGAPTARDARALSIVMPQRIPANFPAAPITDTAVPGHHLLPTVPGHSPSAPDHPPPWCSPPCRPLAHQPHKATFHTS